MQKYASNEPFNSQYSHALENGLIMTSDIVYKTKKGNEFWGNLAITPISIDDTKYVLARVTNISEKKKIDATVKALNQLYLTTLENQQGLNIRVKKEGEGYRVVLARGKFLDKYKTTFADCEGKMLHEVFPGDEYTYRVQHFNDAWEGREVFYETSVPDTDVFYIVFFIHLVSFTVSIWPLVSASCAGHFPPRSP